MNTRHRLRIFIFIAIIACLGVYGGIARASATDRVQGYAWSSNVGWLSLNNCRDTTCSGSNYGVTFSNNDASVGSGYAWSPNIGWVSFNGDQGCPLATCSNGVSIDMTTPSGDGSHAISGWARACSVYASGCSGVLKADDARGGWDGYIALSGTAADGTPFGLRLGSDNTIGGYAWGSDVLGWIQFKGRLSPASPSLSVDLKANDKDLLTVKSGTKVTLSWTVTGIATSCTASEGWKGDKASVGGTESIGAVTNTATYTITCTGAAGTTTDSVSVLVNDGIGGLTVTLGAVPSKVSAGAAATLKWTVAGTATSCTASGGWTGSKSTSGGSQTTGPLFKATTYSISCTGPDGSDSDSTTVLLIGVDGGGDGGPACSNGKDDDGDGLFDFAGGPNGEPADPGCLSPTDTDEFNAKPKYIEL